MENLRIEINELRVAIFCVTCCFLLGSFYAFSLILKDIKEAKDQARGDMAKHQRWLFDALYSINNKVVLPEPKVDDEKPEPAKVYSPSQDPINSLKGMKNDWHG